MRKGILFRIAAALLASVMLMQLCGCTSVIAQTVHIIKEDSEEKEDIPWSYDSYTVKTVKEYPNGTDAFYVDTNKCIKEEIEEFQVLSLTGTTFLYYYTAPSNPDYKGNDRKSGYCCLASYDYKNKLYTVITESFYNRNNSVSLTFDTDMLGIYTCVCIGDTFMYFSGPRLVETHTLDNDEKEEISEKVGSKYLCIDIAMIDVTNRTIMAAYMDISALDNNSDEEPECVVFQIQFDTSEKAEHSIQKLKDGLDSSCGNVMTSCTDLITCFAAYVCESDDDDSKVELKYYSPFIDIIGGKKAKFECKKKDQSLISFTATYEKDYDNIALAILVDNMLYVWERKESKPDTNGKISYSYTYTGVFILDESQSYMTMDDMPSIRIIDGSKHILACSLENGFRLVRAHDTLGAEKTIKTGSYYASYSYDYTNHTLIGFNQNTHNVSRVTYRNGEEVSRTTTQEEYTMADLPYAKVHLVSYTIH